jgi:integrase
MRKSFTINGKRYEVTGKTQRELDDRYFYKRLEVERLLSEKTVECWCKEWLERYKKGKVTEKNYKNYISLINLHIIPYIGKKKLGKVTIADCQNILNRLSGYSAYYIRKLDFTLNGIFRMAELEGMIVSNPAASLVKPKGKIEKRRSLTDVERQKLLYTISGQKYELYFKLMLFCGLRPHECSFIQGKDITDNLLHIRGIKSENADRYVPIPCILPLPELQDNEYLFKNLTENKRNRWWKELKEKLGDVDWTPYCLRHTYCTDLEEAGVPINVARQLMGHSNITLTSKIYTHTTQKTFESVAVTMDSFHTHSHIEI